MHAYGNCTYCAKSSEKNCLNFVGISYLAGEKRTSTKSKTQKRKIERQFVDKSLDRHWWCWLNHKKIGIDINKFNFKNIAQIYMRQYWKDLYESKIRKKKSLNYNLLNFLNLQLYAWQYIGPPPPPTTGTEQKSQNVYLITGNWYRYLINDRSRSRFLTTFIWCGGIPRRDRRNASGCPSSRLSIRTKYQNNATTTFKKHFYLAFTWDSGGLLSWPVIMMGLLENEEIIFFAPEAYCTQCTV